MYYCECQKNIATKARRRKEQIDKGLKSSCLCVFVAKQRK